MHLQTNVAKLKCQLTRLAGFVAFSVLYWKCPPQIELKFRFHQQKCERKWKAVSEGERAIKGKVLTRDAVAAGLKPERSDLDWAAKSLRDGKKWEIY